MAKREVVPIDFTETLRGRCNELGRLCQISGTYGERPRLIKYSIALALAVAKNPENPIRYLPEGFWDLYFTSVKVAMKHKQQTKLVQERGQIHKNV